MAFSVAIQSSAGDFTEIFAYLFECKAPQSSIFERDGKHRLRPSRSLLEAENQLLNYTEECRNSGVWQKLFSIDDPDKILPGGVIIGSNGTAIGEHTLGGMRMYKLALNIRMKYFYSMGQHQMRIFTWDRVLEYVRTYEKISAGAEAV